MSLGPCSLHGDDDSGCGSPTAVTLGSSCFLDLLFTAHWEPGNGEESVSSQEPLLMHDLTSSVLSPEISKAV